MDSRGSQIPIPTQLGPALQHGCVEGLSGHSRQGLAGNIFRLLLTIVAKHPNIYFLRDIVQRATYSQSIELARNVRRGNTTPRGKGVNRFVSIIWHPEQEEESGEQRGHIHIYHTCIYNQSKCTCAFLRGLIIKRRLPRFARPVNQLTEEDIDSWLEYFLSPPREILHLQIGQVSFLGDVHQLQLLHQPIGGEGEGTNGPVEGNGLSRQSVCWEEHDQFTEEVQRNKRSLSPSAETSSKRGKGLPGLGGKMSRYQIDKFKLIKNLELNLSHLLCIPFESACQTSEWNANADLTMFDGKNEEYKLAINRFKKSLVYLELPDIIKMHENATNPIYYARRPNHYLSLDESIAAINMLLMHQYSSQEKVDEFVERLYNIVEMKNAKKNSMFIYGRANCGKTWFLDCLSAFYINVGHIKNFVRSQNFPFQEAPNRRLLVWNEPSIMPSAFDTVKMICSGDPCPAAVKHEGDCTITRTPLIFTSNVQIFQRNDIWNSRIDFENWQPCSQLKQITQYPHPLVFKTLFNKFI